MRFEKKYSIGKANVPNIYNDLIMQGYSCIYNKRSVTSIYYDSSGFDLYHQSEDGCADRSKIRVRFYNNDSPNAFLEYKNKKAESGWKIKSNISTSYPLLYIKSPSFPSFFVPRTLEDIYTPILGVSYERIYIISPCNNIRITFDTKIICGKVYSTGNDSELTLNIKYSDDVMEVKYEKDHSSGFCSLQNTVSKYFLSLCKLSLAWNKDISNKIKIILNVVLINHLYIKLLI